MTKMHKTRNGKSIPISEMSDKHLKNMISFIETKAEEGMSVAFGVGDAYPDSFDMDVDFYIGQEVLDFFNYQDYVDELNRRSGY